MGIFGHVLNILGATRLSGALTLIMAFKVLPMAPNGMKIRFVTIFVPHCL